MRPDATEWLRLCLVPGVPGAAQRALLRAFGSPGAALGASSSSLRAVVGATAASSLADGPAPELLATTLAWLEEPGHHLLVLGDEDYPRDLLQVPDPPTAIHAAGDLSLLNRPTLAIVGSRNATRQGEHDATEFARALSLSGYVIASGLAIGIDAAAHRGGLAGGSSTIAVLGTGLDRVYPAGNRDLAREIAERGALVSEFPLGTAPVAANFPRRNRIISGISQGVIVVEAALRSGSLTTARLALEQGREVFAIPGSIHSPLSKGCHWLIRQGAKLVESVDDVLAELRGLPASDAPPTTEPDEPVDPDASSGRGDALLRSLGHAPATLDALVLRTGWTAQEVGAVLSQLEISGRIERLPGGLFRQLAVP